MVQIKCLGNGLYSLKNSHIPFGQGFQPPPPLTDKDRLNSAFLVLGLPLQLFLQLATYLEFPKTLICGGTEVLVGKPQ